MKDKNLRNTLFGKNTGIGNPFNSRVGSFEFPAKDSNEKRIYIQYASHDGLVLYLLKEIEKLNERLIKLEQKKKCILTLK